MILKASVLIVLLCLIFGICFRYRYRLAEPVFVQQNTAVTAIFDDSEAKPGGMQTLHFIILREEEMTGWYSTLIFRSSSRQGITQGMRHP